MFKKAERLSKQKDISRVLAQGKKVFSRSLILFFLKNGLNNKRATIIVSSKVSKKATERNLIKRRIRELIKKQETVGYDFVAVALKEIKTSDFTGIKKDLERAFNNIK